MPAKVQDRKSRKKELLRNENYVEWMKMETEDIREYFKEQKKKEKQQQNDTQNIPNKK